MAVHPDRPIVATGQVGGNPQTPVSYHGFNLQDLSLILYKSFSSSESKCDNFEIQINFLTMFQFKPAF